MTPQAPSYRGVSNCSAGSRAGGRGDAGASQRRRQSALRCRRRCARSPLGPGARPIGAGGAARALRGRAAWFPNRESPADAPRDDGGGAGGRRQRRSSASLAPTRPGWPTRRTPTSTRRVAIEPGRESAGEDSDRRLDEERQARERETEDQHRHRRICADGEHELRQGEESRRWRSWDWTGWKPRRRRTAGEGSAPTAPRSAGRFASCAAGRFQGRSGKRRR